MQVGVGRSMRRLNRGQRAFLLLGGLLQTALLAVRLLLPLAVQLPQLDPFLLFGEGALGLGEGLDLANAVSEFDVLLDLLLELLLVVLDFYLLQEDLLADLEVVLLDLLLLLAVEVPVAAGHELELVIGEGLHGGLQIPDALEQTHVLPLEMVLFLLLLE